MGLHAPGPLRSAWHRLEGSWVEDLIAKLGAIDLANSITLFAAALLLSVLPFLILLSSLANERVDDDISRHIGLDRAGAHIISSLFRSSPSHATAPIVLGLIIGLAGMLTTVAFLQVIYERVFDVGHRGWRDLPRFILWTLVLLAALLLEGLLDGPLRAGAGLVARDLVSFVLVSIFVAWSMHLLLAGGVPWQMVIRPALLTALLWLALTLISSIYFSSAVISEHRLYGTIGVVFALVTWFIAIGAVIVLGAVGGVVWQERRHRAIAARSQERDT